MNASARNCSFRRSRTGKSRRTAKSVCHEGKARNKLRGALPNCKAAFSAAVGATWNFCDVGVFIPLDCSLISAGTHPALHEQPDFAELFPMAGLSCPVSAGLPGILPAHAKRKKHCKTRFLSSHAARLGDQIRDVTVAAVGKVILSLDVQP